MDENKIFDKHIVMEGSICKFEISRVILSNDPKSPSAAYNIQTNYKGIRNYHRLNKKVVGTVYVIDGLIVVKFINPLFENDSSVVKSCTYEWSGDMSETEINKLRLSILHTIEDAILDYEDVLIRNKDMLPINNHAAGQIQESIELLEEIRGEKEIKIHSSVIVLFILWVMVHLVVMASMLTKDFDPSFNIILATLIIIDINLIYIWVAVYKNKGGKING